MISYPPGTPNWIDVTSPDVEASKSFYGDLLGWETVTPGDPAETGDYHFFTLGGEVVAGLGPVQDGSPPAWNTYIAVESADAAESAIEGAGGTTVVSAFDVFEAGRMGVYTDPAGAFFCTWQAGQTAGSDVVNQVGGYAMAELDTRDRETVEPFYASVFGWTFEPIEQGGAVVYESVKLDGRLIAGLFPIGDLLPPQVPNHWRPYFGVGDVDASAARARELGGQSLTEPMEVPGGRFAALLDPFGASFSLLEAAEYDPPPGG
jgi:uncharacterized protein